MLCVKTTVKRSNIAGLGLFADENILKGTVVWRFEPKLDILLAEEDVNTLTAAAKAQFHNYAFFDSDKGKYILCGDDGRFFNHSTEPNCDDGQNDITIALRDIKIGEELTVDYNTFDADIKKHSLKNSQLKK